MTGEKRIDPIRALFPEELKEFIESHEEGSYTLLDVRQPFEYEEAHLPGARLMPLPHLPDSLDEIDRKKPTIVYCRSGGRSHVAAQLLAHQGFEDVQHLQGGINAWEEPTAEGPVDFHLSFVSGHESPSDVLRTAYRMEVGLKCFHEEVLARTKEEDLAKVLQVLIKAEEKHMTTVRELASTEGLNETQLAREIEESGPQLMEGGFNVSDFLKANERRLSSLTDFVELAMMLETQALDLYLRMAAESRNDRTRKVLLRISDEEKTHLGMLGRYLDEVFTPQG